MTMMEMRDLENSEDTDGTETVEKQTPATNTPERASAPHLEGVDEP